MSTIERQQNFIEAATNKHNGKYDYSKVEYKRNSEKVCIICPIHGEFWQSPQHHLRTNGCKKCGVDARTKIKTLDEFIQKANDIHNGKYDYSKSVFNGLSEKITITCPIHGDFSILAGRHLNKKQKGNGCPLCGDVLRRKNCTKTIDDFIDDAKRVHGDKYDYVNTIYNGSMNNIIVTCKTHGDFTTTPNRFLSGHGCPYCSNNKQLTQEEFIQRSKEIHGDIYDYSKTVYISRPKKIIITCPKHGDFEQLANSHLTGSGCPICKNSKMEIEISNFLKEHDIDFIPYAKFEWLGRQSIDFYIPKYNIGIECQGKQHFCSVEGFGGDERYETQKNNDIKKRELCKEHNVKLLYYTTIENRFLHDCDYKDELIINTDKLWEILKLHIERIKKSTLCIKEM